METSKEERFKSIEGYVKELRGTAKLLCSVLRMIPDKETLFRITREGLNVSLHTFSIKDEAARNRTAVMNYYIMMALIDVIENNPMFGSRALVLQLEAAIDKRMDEYRKELQRVNEDLPNGPTS